MRAAEKTLPLKSSTTLMFLKETLIIKIKMISKYLRIRLGVK
jgi:hypothetical protein